MEVLRGGCTLPPKPPLPSWSSSHPAKDLGWWHSCGWVSWAFQALYPIGFGTVPLPARPCLGCKHLGENLKLREKKGKHEKNQNQAPFSQVLPQLHGNFPADGKLWKSHVSARMNVSMFSPWCGHGCGVRAVRGPGAGSWDGADPTARPGRAAHGAGRELTGTGGPEQPRRHCQSPWRAAAGAGCPPDPDLPGERAQLPAGAGCSPAAAEGLWLLLSLLPALLVQPAPGPCHHGLPCSPARECHRLWPCRG